MTDLSHITTMLQPLYGAQGAEKPRDPASMLRSYLLNLFVRPKLGPTAWVTEMHRVPLYAIFSGFEPGDVPGVGTFYDFFPRLWDAQQKHYSSKVKSTKARKRKPKKGKKGKKSPISKPGRVERLVRWITPRIPDKKPLPSDRLLISFNLNFLLCQLN